MRESALETALRELVEDIAEADILLDVHGDEAAALGPERVTAEEVLYRTNCPECDEDPEESIGLCPYHAAKALLGGAA